MRARAGIVPCSLGNWKLETGNWKLETGNWKLETVSRSQLGQEAIDDGAPGSGGGRRLRRQCRAAEHRAAFRGRVRPDGIDIQVEADAGDIDAELRGQLLSPRQLDPEPAVRHIHNRGRG